MMDDGPFSKGHIDQKLFMYAESGQNRQNIPFPKCNIISFLTLLHLLRVFCLVVAGVSLAAASSDKYFNQEVDKTTGGFLEPEEEVNPTKGTQHHQHAELLLRDGRRGRWRGRSSPRSQRRHSILDEVCWQRRWSCRRMW